MFKKKIIFNLNLELIQNIRFALALMEKDILLVLDRGHKDKFDYLSSFFKIKIRYKNKKKIIKKANKFIFFDHKKPEIGFYDVSLPLVFPEKMIYLCSQFEKKDIKFSFNGLITKKRETVINDWLKKSISKSSKLNVDKNFSNKETRILNSTNGRKFPIKCWDADYFKIIQGSKFVLCPNGDYVWTYRFFEAIACGAIPIVEEAAPCYKDFFFYTFKTPYNKILYLEEKVEKNLFILKENFTFKNL